MTFLRKEKIDRVANYIPQLEVEGEKSGDLLIVGWGGTYGALATATKELQQDGKKISLAQFNFINPLPKNVGEVFGGFKKILVCELNLGQFVFYLRSMFPQFSYLQYNKVQGLPFLISELKSKFNEVLNSL